MCTTSPDPPFQVCIHMLELNMSRVSNYVSVKKLSIISTMQCVSKCWVRAYVNHIHNSPCQKQWLMCHIPQVEHM